MGLFREYVYSQRHDDHEDSMKRRHAGFTLVEMLIVIAIFGFVLAGTSQMFIDTLRTHRQQTRITETNIEGIIGLELFRQDLEKAGYGLPWNGTLNYLEKDPDTLNLNDATTNPPRGIVGVHDVTTVANIIPHSDYLTIKASSVATNAACAKWTFLPESGSGPPTQWSLNSGATATSENFKDNDRIIVISPGVPNSPLERTLVTAGSQYWSQFNAAAAFAAPVSGPETRVIYGIDTGDVRMPFNRADYYVKIPDSTEMPKRCAHGTGNLYKGVVRQSDGGLQEMPLLDCVADMQVIFKRDLDGNGFAEDWTQDISTSTAPDIRNQVKEVRVFILAHEGQRDTNYQHPRSSEHVGDPSYGRDFNFSANGITDWQNYRWKIYTLVVSLNNLK